MELDPVQKKDPSLTDSKRDARQAVADKQWTRPEVLRDRRLYLLLPAFMSQTLFFTGFIFHQVMLTESKGWSLSLWGTLFIMYAIISMLTKLATGVLVDKIGCLRLVPIVPIPLALGLMALGLSSDISAAIIFLAMLGLATGMQTTISTPLWAELYGTLHLGSIKSLMSALIAFSSALSPFILGWFIDHDVTIEALALYSVAWIVIAVAMAVAVVKAR